VLIACLTLEWEFLILCFGIGGSGLFLIPILPLSFDLACECSFPVGEAVAAGMLMTGGQIVGIIQVKLFNIIHEIFVFGTLESTTKSTAMTILYVSVSLYGIATLLILCHK